MSTQTELNNQEILNLKMEDQIFQTVPCANNEIETPKVPSSIFNLSSLMIMLLEELKNSYLQLALTL